MSTSPASQRDQFRRLAVLIAVNAVDMVGFAIVLPLLPFYALDFHATAVQVGWLMAAFSIAQLLSAPLWGRVSDRYGRRPALLIGLYGLGRRRTWSSARPPRSGCCSRRA